MAVGKSKTSRSKRGMRRGSNTTSLLNQILSEDGFTGEKHPRYFVTDSGVYKGKKVLENKS